MPKIDVQGIEITIINVKDEDYISLTDMLKAKDGDFFISDWLRNRNTVEFLGIWERIYNPNFNYGEFAIIKSQVGLNSYFNSIEFDGIKNDYFVGARNGNLSMYGTVATVPHKKDHSQLETEIQIIIADNGK